ncbi:MAG: hypothetical protein ACTHOJ_07450 [Sphingomonas oligoaromativorans]
MASDGGAAGGVAAGGGEGAAGGAGGVADLLGGGAAAAEGAAAGTGEGGGADASWLEHFSATAEGEDNSNRDWLQAKGFKDLDAVAKSLRSAEREITTLKAGGAGAVKIPGEGASAEEIAAFRQSIGVPDKADAYEFKVGAGVKLDEGMTSRLREAAFKAGVPKGAFEALASDYVQMQLDDMAAVNRQQDEAAQAKLTEWGAQRGQKEAAVNSAMRALGLSREDAGKLRFSLGAGRTLDLMARIGEGIAEDFMSGGDGQRFGVSPAEAQAEIDKLKVDPEFQKKVMVKNSPEKARWDRLTAILPAALDPNQKHAS